MELQSYMDAWHAAGRFDGSVAVVHGGKVLLRQGYGPASYEHTVPNRPDTAFKIGSVTKSFVAAAVLQLAAQGKLRLDDSPEKHLPDYRHARAFTLHHLLSNTAGVPDHTGFPEYSTGERVSPKALLARLNQRELLYRPGEGVNYSNSHYFLLARVLEAVTGTDVATCLRSLILVPGGLNHTGDCTTAAAVSGLANGYSYSGEGPVPAEPFDMSGAYGSGFMYANLDDLVAWVRLLMRDPVYRPMFTPYAHLPHMQGWYGYGCFVNGAAITMSGLICGYSCLVRHDREHDLSVVLLSNNDAMPLQRMARGLAEMATTGVSSVVIKPEPTDVALPDLAGTYRSPYTGASFTISREHGVLCVDRLFAQEYRQKRFALYPVSATTLACEVCDSRFTFPGDGRAIYSFDVFDIPYQRI